MAYHGGYRDVRPKVRQYGHVEDAEDEQVDPRILAEEARKAEAARKEDERRGPQSFVTMGWSPERGLRAAPWRARPQAARDGREDEADFPPPPPEPADHGCWSDLPLAPVDPDRWRQAPPPPGSHGTFGAAFPWLAEPVGQSPPTPPSPPPWPYGPPPGAPGSPHDQSGGGGPYGR